MPFGEIVIGSPGSGKSTYAYGKYQLCTALHRPIAVVNLDPANDHLPYPCAIDIASLISLQDVMDTSGLGPNGALIYCMEYLEQNFDWLEEELAKLEEGTWVVFDIAGQVELSTNHESLREIVERLQKLGYRLAAVHLCDAHYVTDASKYISVLLLSLRTMLQLELPHINVLSKVDLITQYGDLPFNLDFYTEVQDLSHLSHQLSTQPGGQKFASLNEAICELVEDFGLVGFETLAVEVRAYALRDGVICQWADVSQDKTSMLRLLRVVDKATGYIFAPPPGSHDPSSTQAPDSHTRSTSAPNTDALFSSAFSSLPGPGDVRDVQERWVDERERWDEWEREEWRKEGESVARKKAGRELREKEAEKRAKEQNKPGKPVANAGQEGGFSEMRIRDRTQA
ncbi:hypothetical protein DACRYDRAFT_17536 [Dacryopinax primogenitus]|uniref:GPN-loop GTPase 2 n=1 Tax=Dacryopinax primogenitus (strain DJM 731) TaxID=1858805 RepID=M5FQW4_DACPD|nr:uncharacterized protein DACRYDRAFT_17536 [Dacryopinax primogenitus]EJT99385.1 hypothetical protein DACRYDRAFT_17536 [Dacryopinax primogenitus]